MHYIVNVSIRLTEFKLRTKGHTDCDEFKKNSLRFIVLLYKYT